MKRRGFLAALLAVPAALLGVSAGKTLLPGMTYEPVIADPDAKVNILEYHGDAPPLDEEMLDEAFESYWHAGEGLNRHIMGVVRQENDLISKYYAERYIKEFEHPFLSEVLSGRKRLR